MKKFMYLFLTLILSLFIGIKVNTYFKSIEAKINLLSSSVINEIPVLNNLQTSDKNNLQNLNFQKPDFVEIAKKTIDNVVHVKNSSNISNDFSLEDLIFGRRQQRPLIGTGSGVIISPDGYIITNSHVIKNADKIEVTTNSNQTFDAELIGSDDKNDIALLKINSNEVLSYATFGDSDSTQIGEWVLAVGNPFNLNSTVTAGIISAKSRNLDPSGRTTQSYIQTDAAVNPGNSGGALVNTKGQLIGINTAIQSQTGSYIGYSFAVPSNIAKKVIEDIMEFGVVQYGFLGVTGSSLNSSISKVLGIKDTEGFYINSIEEGSGANIAGIKSGDIIKQIDGISINKFSDLKGYLNSKRPNDVVKIKLKTNSKETLVSVKLNKNERIQFYLIGILKNISKDELKQFNVSSGVKISEFNDNYKKYWNDYGIKIGNIVKSINGNKIQTILDVEKILISRNYHDPINIEIINDNNIIERFNFR
ncbi:MAG: trypsin-like serine protease [Flavobacteriaceae bacterium]|jgi:Do/DeqQ family serine protease|nr:trypsin-like serine protease [Flavobacteriaceae bacterium]MBT4112422.1 trypsin-like serine protease [Flavobacteriaceae bacterium]MBT4614276.1 trypsin-like serine protease [Flavobacteriaceae bacterium]MBT5246729.1 trypsin-like serine protease [Flavobacteriaceae bacterium]MBT5649914.1 trypsin-like serine protease [Flavobacteriaceae bacterium]